MNAARAFGASTRCIERSDAESCSSQSRSALGPPRPNSRRVPISLFLRVASNGGRAIACEARGARRSRTCRRKAVT